MNKIGCIIVLFNPDKSHLFELVNRLKEQVDTIYLIDNSNSVLSDLSESESEKIIYEKLPGNLGIANAQNIGIEFFVQNKYDYILFVDQDSLVPQNIIAQYLQDISVLLSKNIKFGGIAALPINKQTNKPYITLSDKNAIDNSLFEDSYILNSGSFIPVENFVKSGYMEGDLFIDGVDSEWCWRANSKIRLRFFYTTNVNLIHQLGEGDRKFLFKKVAISTPFRSYYQFRNYFILLRRSYVPLKWKLSNGIKYLIKIIYYPIFVAPRMEHFQNIMKGIKDGLLLSKSNKQSAL